MKPIIILFAALFFLPVLSFSQNAINKIAEVTNLLKQDTSKKNHPEHSGQSNLAVSDEGAGGGKTKSQSSKTASADKPKSSQTTNPPAGGTGTSNIAVSDEGATGVKGKSNTNTKKEITTTDTTQPKKKEGVTAPAPK